MIFRICYNKTLFLCLTVPVTHALALHFGAHIDKIFLGLFLAIFIVRDYGCNLSRVQSMKIYALVCVSFFFTFSVAQGNSGFDALLYSILIYILASIAVDIRDGKIAANEFYNDHFVRGRLLALYAFSFLNIWLIDLFFFLHANEKFWAGGRIVYDKNILRVFGNFEPTLAFFFFAPFFAYFFDKKRWFLFIFFLILFGVMYYFNRSEGPVISLVIYLSCILFSRIISRPIFKNILLFYFIATILFFNLSLYLLNFGKSHALVALNTFFRYMTSNHAVLGYGLGSINNANAQNFGQHGESVLVGLLGEVGILGISCVLVFVIILTVKSRNIQYDYNSNTRALIISFLLTSIFLPFLWSYDAISLLVGALILSNPKNK